MNYVSICMKGVDKMNRIDVMREISKLQEKLNEEDPYRVYLEWLKFQVLMRDVRVRPRGAF